VDHLAFYDHRGHCLACCFSVGRAHHWRNHLAEAASVSFTPERWYQHQLLILSKQLADASQELRVLRGAKVARALAHVKSWWWCKTTLPKIKK
jgi:hypothetical protein